MKQQLMVKSKGKEKEEDLDAEMMIKTSWRMPKPLMKQLKQYALDNDMNLQQVALKAFTELVAAKG